MPGSPLPSTSHDAIVSSLKEIRTSSSSENFDKGALTVLKSIESEVKTQGEMLSAFIASGHQFRRQVANELAGIKELLAIENARYARLFCNHSAPFHVVRG